jgi:hypothetical protein
MARTNTSPEQRYPYPYAAVFDAVVATLPRVPATIRTADPATGIVTASTGMGARSWGERITVTVWEPAPGSTALTITSQTTFQLVDWGKNSKNITTFLTALTSYVDHNLAHLRGPDAPPAP